MNKELMGALDENWNARKISAKETLLDAIGAVPDPGIQSHLEKLTMYMLPLTEKQAISVYMQTAGL